MSNYAGIYEAFQSINPTTNSIEEDDISDEENTNRVQNAFSSIKLNVSDDGTIMFDFLDITMRLTPSENDKFWPSDVQSNLKIVTILNEKGESVQPEDISPEEIETLKCRVKHCDNDSSCKENGDCDGDDDVCEISVGPKCCGGKTEIDGEKFSHFDYKLSMVGTFVSNTTPTLDSANILTKLVKAANQTTSSGMDNKNQTTSSGSKTTASNLDEEENNEEEENDEEEDEDEDEEEDNENDDPVPTTEKFSNMENFVGNNNNVFKKMDMKLLLKALLFSCLFYLLAHPDTRNVLIKAVNLRKSQYLYLGTLLFFVGYLILNIIV